LTKAVMRTTKVLSLSLPPDLVREAERLAKEEGRTKSEILREALRRHVTEHRWRALQRYGADRARKARITKGDVNRLVLEHRRSR
jgi:CopG family transcriptional regulator/antitoxin EndoAI